MTREPSSSEVLALRERSGAGIMICKKALEVCNGDFLLAEGYIKYYGCAINVRPKEGEIASEAYDKWVMEKAQEWTDLKLKKTVK